MPKWDSRQKQTKNDHQKSDNLLYDFVHGWGLRKKKEQQHMTDIITAVEKQTQKKNEIYLDFESAICIRYNTILNQYCSKLSAVAVCHDYWWYLLLYQFLFLHKSSKTTVCQRTSNSQKKTSY